MLFVEALYLGIPKTTNFECNAMFLINNEKRRGCFLCKNLAVIAVNT